MHQIYRVNNRVWKFEKFSGIAILREINFDRFLDSEFWLWWNPGLEKLLTYVHQNGECSRSLKSISRKIWLTDNFLVPTLCYSNCIHYKDKEFSAIKFTMPMLLVRILQHNKYTRIQLVLLSKLLKPGL